MSSINDDNHGETVKKPLLRDKVIPVLTISLVLAITVALVLYRDEVSRLSSFGYPGVFLISLAFNASIFLPMPIFPVLFVLGALLNPAFIGLAAAAGGALGEMSGYMAGLSGRGIASRSRVYMKAEGWMERWGLLTIFLFAVTPLAPFDLAGMAAGTLRFPVWKFLLVCFTGKALLYGAVAFAGAWGLEAVLHVFR